MAVRRLIRRRVRCARPVVRRTPSVSTLAARKDAKRDMSGDSGLILGGVKDPAEKVADQMANRVMSMPASGFMVHRKGKTYGGGDKKVHRRAAETDNEGLIKAKAAPNTTPATEGASAVPASRRASGAIRSMGHGKPLAPAERVFFEPRFNTDLSLVRIHDDPAAHKATKSINARAFTLGKGIAFAKGERMPGTDRGRHLLAHELAHVVSGHKVLRRKGDVCPEEDAASHRARFATEVAKAHADNDDNRTVRAIKKLLRCDLTADDAHVSSVMARSYSAEKTKELMVAGKTALGGHVGFYPGFAGDIKSRLKEIGVTDAEGHKAFTTSSSGSKHKKRAAKKAKGAQAQLERADIVYFRGHQFAQYRAPGMFTDGAEERGVDLRYLKRAGGFPNVKLMISTSCATLCNEAISVFTSLFPKTAIFGYGRSAPIEGKQVRREFGKQVRALKSPLLLESASDVSKLAGAWKATIQKRHPKEKNVEKIRPGFYLSKLFYWTGKDWIDGKKGQPDNNCKRKGDFRGQYPAPP